MKKLNRAINAAMLFTLAACSSQSPAPEFHMDDAENVLIVKSDNTVTWNGVAITLAELKHLLEETSEMQPEPQLRFEPEAYASYKTSAEILRVIKNSGVRNLGFVGNEKYRAAPSEQAKD